MNQLAREVKQLRRSTKLSLSAFAKRSGLARRHYDRIEKGKIYDVRISTLHKIAEAGNATLIIEFKVGLKSPI
jgi:transcriptional regulator with XRE-family HTH domain